MEGEDSVTAFKRLSPNNIVWESYCVGNYSKQYMEY